MLTAAGSPLVAGSSPANTMSNVSVKSKGTGFYMGGKLVKPGTVVTVPASLGADLVVRGKADKVAEERPPDDGKGGK